MKDYRKRYYRNNRETERQRIAKRKRELKQKMHQYKLTLSCSRCGFKGSDGPWAIDFHHVDSKTQSDDDVEVSHLIRNGYSFKRIMAEIEKCEPVCANCHRIIHYEEHYGE